MGGPYGYGALILKHLLQSSYLAINNEMLHLRYTCIMSVGPYYPFPSLIKNF